MKKVITHSHGFKKPLVLLLLFAIFCLKTYAQDRIKVNGTVTEAETGTTLPGVTVKVKNTTTGIATDASGKFTISVPAGSTLVFTYVGYAAQEKKVTGSVLNVRLAASQGSLSEVVVVGYGSSSKTNLATATSSLSAKEIKNAVVTTIDQALQGRTSGVMVTQASGEPGADAVIRIRGNNSLNGDNQPLYVVDGFPMPPYVEASANGYGSSSQNGLYGINPNDIESLEVLKDAAATAIYGSRGANGVILIKTKSGKGGEPKLEFVTKTSFGTTANPYKMMNSPEYADVINQGFSLQNIAPPFSAAAIAGLPSGTDWFKAITRTGIREDATLNVSGGTGKTSYYISGDYLSDKGDILGAKNVRGSVRANVNSDVNSWYTIKAQLSLVRQNTARAVSDGKGYPATDGPILDALRASPIVSKNYAGFDGEGIPGFQDGNYFSNPYTELQLKTDNLLNDYTVVNFENQFKFSKDLQLVVSLGSNQNLTRRQQYFPVTTGEGYSQNGTGSNNMANTYSYNVNAYLNYNKTFSHGHELNLTGGVEYNNQSLELLNTSSSGFDIPTYGINNIGSADIQSVGSYKEERTIQSAFLRANYSFNEKYVVNASVRIDGASPFAESKKYGTFPAVGIAWNLNKENFMEDVTWLTNSKVRLSYGETGSQAIAPYSSLAQYGNAFYQTGTGTGTNNTTVFPNSIGNSNLSWERTKQADAGVDFSVLHNFLNISFDYYNKTTDGLLQGRALPSQSGFGSILDNYGSIRNRGVDLNLSAKIVKSGDFQYNTKLEISHNKTVLLNLGDVTAPQYIGLGGNLSGGVSGILQPGKEIGLFYGEKVTGLVQTGDIVGGVPNYAFAGSASDQVAGEWKFQDVNKDGKIDNNDRQVLGHSTPLFTYGWNNDISYKSFGVNLFFTGSEGNDVLNLTRMYLSDGLADYSGIFFNQTQDWYTHRWTPTNPTNDPRYPGIAKNIPISDINSSMIENGSYLRLKSATIYYNLPNNKVLKGARIFFTGTNIFTITKYTGFDPEVSSYGQSLLQQGIDFGTYPSSRTYTIGFSSNF